MKLSKLWKSFRGEPFQLSYVRWLPGWMRSTRHSDLVDTLPFVVLFFGMSICVGLLAPISKATIIALADRKSVV